MRLRTAVPARGQAAVRTATRRLGQATSSLRLEPGLIVAGAQRCGTTTLYHLLAAHPSVVRPLLHKGIGYFDLAYDRPWSWYRGHFPLAGPAALRTRRSGPPMTFDSSGYYMFHPLAPARIAEHLPGVRVVVLLRDPVDRAWSAYRHERARGFETLEFEDALAAEETRLAGEEDRLRADPSYRSFGHRHHGYLARGRYAEQVRRLRTALGPDQVLTIDANEFFADPHQRYAELLSWLGLPAWQPNTVPHDNARPGAPLAASLRRELSSHFERSDTELAELIGAVPSWRR